jgi:hypothetical protein
MYALSIFLLGCGGYTVKGQTNFDMTSNGALRGQGISGSINVVGASTDVFVPPASYAVSAADVGRIIVLKSQVYPRSNSGLFRILSANVGNNTLRVDYRSLSTPPAESYLSWKIFDDEITARGRWHSGSNGTTGYGSFNYSALSTASTSRITLRSPHPTSWEVRLCLESLQDVNGNVPSGFSIAPGFGGDASGDFFPIPSGDGPGHDQVLHLHPALYYNSSSSLYRGMVVGLTPILSATLGTLWTVGQWRISMTVDDFSGSACIINRNSSLPASVGSGSGWAAFGLGLDEQNQPVPNLLSDPSVNCPRLFVVGSSNGASNLTWTSQFHADNNMQVVGFGKRGYPIPGVLSCYSDISNPRTHARYLTSSVGTAWVGGAAELFDVDIVVGTIDQTISAGTVQPVFPLQPRRLGRLPFFMQGPANYPQWATTTDPSSSYYHALDGVFMEWGGPRPTDSTTGSSYTAATSQFELQAGLGQFGSFLPGSDLEVPIVGPRTHDFDATRFRKTYSFYRQVPVFVGVVKGGSNPSKP